MICKTMTSPLSVRSRRSLAQNHVEGAVNWPFKLVDRQAAAKIVVQEAIEEAKKVRAAKKVVAAAIVEEDTIEESKRYCRNWKMPTTEEVEKRRIAKQKYHASIQNNEELRVRRNIRCNKRSQEIRDQKKMISIDEAATPAGLEKKKMLEEKRAKWRKLM